ncbi:MAG: hypothetical protein A2X86_01560 [Bdellovibrionales bacterium GWA2_49_15]|nr:MAG: hypothetical protein A2X86_01560 [Bdellovibrionales bacterium GWA2_49_15]
MFFSTLILVLLMTWVMPSHAEYRVYQYYVKAQVDLPYDAQSYITLSTFDPVAYLAYHGGRDSIRVELLNTWMCKGHTGGKELCPSPYEQNSGTSVGSNP